MITPSVLSAFKLENSPHKIIHLTFKTKDFVFRTLSINEHRHIMSLSESQHELEELVCQTTLLYPNPDTFSFSECGTPGVCEYAHKIIIEQSLTGNIEAVNEELELQRMYMNGLYYQAFMTIRLSFPEITKEIYDNMCWREVLEYVAMSEKMIMYKQQINNTDVEFKLSLLPNEEIGEDEEKPSEEELIKIAEQQEKEFVHSLREDGIDPASYYNIPLVTRSNVIERPLIGGRYWNDEVKMREIGEKVFKTQQRRQRFKVL